MIRVSPHARGHSRREPGSLSGMIRVYQASGVF